MFLEYVHFDQFTAGQV